MMYLSIVLCTFTLFYLRFFLKCFIIKIARGSRRKRKIAYKEKGLALLPDQKRKDGGRNADNIKVLWNGHKDVLPAE